MILVKKLAFAPLFLLSLGFTFYHSIQVFSTPNLVFSVNITVLSQLVILVLLILLTSLLFVLFVTLSDDWRFIFAISFLATLLPFFFITFPTALVISSAILISLLIIYLGLNITLKTYLDFRPTSLLSNPVKNLARLIILVFCINFFFTVNTQIKKQGFSLPDELIDTALKFVNLPQIDSQSQTPQLNLSQEQIDLVKQNPDLLKQYNLDPKILDSLESQNQQSNPTQNLIKQTVKDQIQALIDPYINYIPLVLAILLYTTLSFGVSIFSLIVAPIIWLIFLILEKTGYIHYATQMREVKKMVV